MGASASRAATSGGGRSFAAAEAAAAAAAKPHQAAGGAVAVDAQRAAAAASAPRLSLEQEEAAEARHAGLGSLLDALGGAVEGRAVAVAPHASELRPRAARPVPGALPGRLPAHAVRALFAAQAGAAGGPVDTAPLAAKYGVAPELMAAVLASACLPEIRQADFGPRSEVAAVAAWPNWFARRQRR